MRWLSLLTSAKQRFGTYSSAGDDDAVLDSLGQAVANQLGDGILNVRLGIARTWWRFDQFAQQIVEADQRWVASQQNPECSFFGALVITR